MTRCWFARVTGLRKLEKQSRNLIGWVVTIYCRAKSPRRPSALAGASDKLVQITLDRVGDGLRLRRLMCGKASPFRGAGVLKNLLRAGWKAEPSSLCGGGRGLRHWPESRRLSARQGGGAALSAR